MKLDVEIRNRMRIGVASGFLFGISFYIWEIFSWFIVEEWITFLVGLIIWVGAGLIYDHGKSKIPRIVAEVEKELGKAQEQVKTGKFFCRYCGVENKSDAVFCEKCGKKVVG